jgi:hypothetical protein
MDRRSLLLSALCLPTFVAPAPALAADGPEVTVERFLAANAAGDLAPVRGQLTGEAANWDSAPGVSKGADFKVARQGEAQAIARIRVERPDQASPDGYLYLRREDGAWKIHAHRGLATIEVLVALRRQLRAKSALGDDDRRLLANLELTLASDADLRVWFADHRESCDEFVDMARSAQPGDGAPLQQYVEDLGFSSFVPDEPFQLVLGGMVDNSVGFLHTRGRPPPMDPSDFIWIEPLGGGWSLFKTT